MPSQNDTLSAVLARQRREADFLRGLKDAADHGRHEARKDLVLAAAVWAGVAAYRKFRRAGP
jgi:hypothetical protein